MPDMNIDQLSLNIKDAAGHEHRIHGITARAATLFAQRLQERWANNSGPEGTATLDSIAALPVSFDLTGISDQEAASKIANAWLETLALNLKF